MKLRHEKGKPLIVLEPGDIAAIEKVRTLLVGASVHLSSDADSMDNLVSIAGDLDDVLLGRVPGIALPKKRRVKHTDQAGNVADVPPDPPGFDDLPKFDAELIPKCVKCQAMLTRSERRARRTTCLKCEPVCEGAA